MATIPLNADGGTATLLATRITNDADARLAELAARKGMKRPELVRQVIMWGLERAEREEREREERARSGPPTGG